MPNKIFLEDQEYQTVQAMWQALQAKQTEAALAQIAVNAYVQTLATTRGLDPKDGYTVSNRGELLVQERPPRPTPAGESSSTEPVAPQVEGQAEAPPQVTVEPSPTGKKLNRAQSRSLKGGKEK